MFISFLSRIWRVIYRNRALLLIIAFFVFGTLQLSQLSNSGSVLGVLNIDKVGYINSRFRTGRTEIPQVVFSNHVDPGKSTADQSQLPPVLQANKESISTSVENLPHQHQIASSSSLFPKVQFDFPPETEIDRIIRETRYKKVKEGFVHAWTGYRKYAFGADELRPLSNKKANPFNGWGATIVDALDTLLVLDLKSFYMEAREHIMKINFTKSETEISLFETNIRYLGGLLSAYELSGGDDLMLKKAVSLADALLPTFKSKTGLPVPHLNLGSGDMKYESTTGLADAGTLSLEFSRLAQLTGNMKYYDPVQKIADFFVTYKDEKYPGMYPNSFDIESGKSNSKHYSFGGVGDSFYEYLLKEHILIGGSNSQYKDMYIASVEALKKHFLKRGNISSHPEILFIGQHAGTYQSKMEQLTCFMPALLALGSKILNRPDDLRIAEGVAEGCVWACNATVTGIGWDMWKFEEGEQVNVEHEDNNFGGDKGERNEQNLLKRSEDEPIVGDIPQGIVQIDGRYFMRPETLESMFYLYRITGNKKWQEYAWRIFEAIERHCRTDSAYAALGSVDNLPAPQIDNLQSFFFAETLKYAALIFTTPDTLSLDEWVFNTEAHPLKIPTMKWKYAEVARKRRQSTNRDESKV